MRKIISMILALACALLIFAGCSADAASMAYTFSVDNGDAVRIEMDTTGNYAISSDVPFIISCDGETQSQGAFILAETYDQYVSVVETDANAKLLDAGNRDGNDYIFWSYNDAEFNYAVRIGGTNTGIVIGNIISEESAKECFRRLTITVEG